MTSSFSVYRLWSLMRSDFLAERRALTWAAGTFVFVVLFLSLQQIQWGHMDYSMYQKLYGYGLFIWGIFTTSRCFRVVHDPTRNEAYLLLPVSSLEKFFSRLLPVTVGIGIFLPIFLFALTAIIELVSIIIIGTRRPLFNPFDIEIWKLYGYYIIIQAPFFLGAIWFRRFNFLITSCAIILFYLLLVIAILITARITIGSTDWQDFLHFGIAHDTFHHLFTTNWNFLAMVFWIVVALLPPVLWWITWLRLKEVQVDHGVQ